MGGEVRGGGGEWAEGKVQIEISGGNSSHLMWELDVGVSGTAVHIGKDDGAYAGAGTLSLLIMPSAFCCHMTKACLTAQPNALAAPASVESPISAGSSPKFRPAHCSRRSLISGASSFWRTMT